MQCQSTRMVAKGGRRQVDQRTGQRVDQGPLPLLRAQTLSEIFPASSCDAGAVSFALSGAIQGGQDVFWVQDRQSAREAGRPYLPGMPPQRIIEVSVNRAVDVLWAMEEALRCKTLGLVIGEIWGDPPALSFTATKRLALRAEAGGTSCWMIRRAAAPNLSAARNRWRIASLASAPHQHDAKAPGDPRWRAELFRCRAMRPGEWTATYDRAAHRVHFSPPFRDGAVDEDHGADRRRAAG